MRNDISITEKNTKRIELTYGDLFKRDLTEFLLVLNAHDIPDDAQIVVSDDDGNYNTMHVEVNR